MGLTELENRVETGAAATTEEIGIAAVPAELEIRVETEAAVTTEEIGIAVVPAELETLVETEVAVTIEELEMLAGTRDVAVTLAEVSRDSGIKMVALRRDLVEAEAAVPDTMTGAKIDLQMTGVLTESETESRKDGLMEAQTHQVRASQPPLTVRVPKKPIGEEL